MEPRSINIHQAVIDECKKGSRKAQYRLYELYYKAMYNTALRILVDEGEAEDVIQESFLSAFKNLNQYRGDSAFGAWLKRIVVNKSLNELKKRREESDVDNIDIAEEPFYEWENVPEKNLNIEQVKLAIADLPDGFRTVLTLYLFEGYDHKEIGEILNISESTSKSQYNRAKKKVRMTLNKEVKYG